MSLAVDGVWKSGVWAPTVWAEGVWHEGAAVVAHPQTSAGGRVYPYPQDFPKRKKRKVIRQPLPEYEVSGPLARQTALEHPILPKWDQDAWEASLKTLAYLETEQKVRKQKTTESILLVWMA